MLKSYLLLAVLLSVFTGCAYRLGSPDRSLPGGYRQVFIPIFLNRSMEPGIEVEFTNSLIQEFERAKIGRVTDKNQAEVLVEGVITSVTYEPTSLIDTDLPAGSVLADKYRILVEVSVTLRRQSDKSVLWTGNFLGERPYNAPLIKTPGISTANPLYNLSARRQNIGVLAASLMLEAHDRITENF